MTDVEQAKSIHRDFLTKFNEVGHVPRNAMRDMDNRVRRVNERVSDLEAEEWRRTDPEARQRADDMVTKFQEQVDKLAKQLADAEAKGDERKAKDVRKSLETYTAWLEQAKETSAEFTA